MDRDEAVEQAGWLAQVKIIAEGVNDLPGVKATLVGPPERAVPVVQLAWDEPQSGWPGLELVNALAAGTPPICVAGDGAGGRVTLSPFSLRPGEAEIIAACLRDILGNLRR